MNDVRCASYTPKKTVDGAHCASVHLLSARRGLVFQPLDGRRYPDAIGSAAQIVRKRRMAQGSARSRGLPLSFCSLSPSFGVAGSRTSQPVNPRQLIALGTRRTCLARTLHALQPDLFIERIALHVAQSSQARIGSGPF